MRRFIGILAPLTAALLACGCAASKPVTIQHWQQSLERYAIDQANGDPSFVRAMPGEPRRIFAVHGHPKPQQSTDVIGVLLGRREFAGAEHNIYLLGTVRREQLVDVRLAAMSGGHPTRWLISPDNPQALRAYNARNEQWKASHGGPGAAPIDYRAFPFPSDAYELAAGPESLTVTETRTGARWVLQTRSGARQAEQ